MRLDRRLVPFAISLALGAGCNRGPEQELGGLDTGRAADEIFQDVGDDGTRLFASVQPALPHSDAPRTLVVRWLERDVGPTSWAFEGQGVLDARLVPATGSALVITAARELVLLESRHAEPVPLDTRVHAPLSLSGDGRYVAYSRGEVPDLEVVRFDLSSRTAAGATRGMAPAWSPALSEDGSRLVFVSGKSGLPELWELARNGSVVQLSDRQRDPVPFPQGPTAPIWSGEHIAFESPDGVQVLSLAPLRVARALPGALPVAGPRAGVILVQPRAGGAPRWESVSGSEVSR